MSLLELRHVSKRFGSYKALDDVSFSVEPGRIVGLIGPNGAGKSTAMRAMTGLMRFDEGEIVFDGQPVQFSKTRALAKMGNLIEYPSIYPNFTARDHMKYYAMDSKDPEDIDELMALTGIDGDNFGKRKAKHFSLGMKQRLGIAIALVRKPKLVILDEPMNGLDPQSVREIRELIQQLSEKGIAFVVSSHILDELQRLADDVVIINKGQIIRQTTMADFLSENKAQVKVKTSDNEAMLEAAKAAGWQAKLGEDKDVMITVEEGVNAQAVLRKATAEKIDVQDIQTGTANLEEHLMEVLSDKEKKA
ncbi:ABC transporter ATP-binding protein [Fructobacillus sp. M1-13]|uniref:ABC transporter ATP-binding protein n=1 Tax=Fructobacillus papyriferae TaxID=2713171 RepID=A0ABS5QPN7_9LACO|nr:ABC transporter ATP-binding protein [Fructobacillus papyriferae]MBS9335138.1 ABC transporter ATP-binding protein [Fructobacillus papyriferae]MCD2159192.1 ABC transporter ATP-binding protein [Fructobacillus papyriferae]